MCVTMLQVISNNFIITQSSSMVTKLYIFSPHTSYLIPSSIYNRSGYSRKTTRAFKLCCQWLWYHFIHKCRLIIIILKIKTEEYRLWVWVLQLSAKTKSKLQIQEKNHFEIRGQLREPIKPIEPFLLFSIFNFTGYLISNNVFLWLLAANVHDLTHLKMLLTILEPIATILIFVSIYGNQIWLAADKGPKFVK